MKKLTKPVYLISNEVNLKDIDQLVIEGRTYFIRLAGTIYDKSDFETVRELDKLKKTRLDGDESLFFLKCSKFPRTKLMGTNFKRVVKPEKADVLVYKDLCLFTSIWVVDMFETNNSYFAISYNTRYRYLDRDEYIANPAEYIKNYVHDIAQLNPTFLGRMSIANTRYEWLLDKIIDGTAPSLISDKELNDIVCKSMPEITEEEVFSIKEMLESKDFSVAGLGLKILGSYNLDCYKRSLGLIIKRRHRFLKQLNEWNCVSFKQVRTTTLCLPYDIGDQYFYTYAIRDSEGKDKDLVIKILYDYFKKDCYNANIPSLSLVGKQLKFSLCQV